MPRALLLTGAGRYSDPWHPLEETSRQLGGILADAGFDVVVSDDVDASLRELDGFDLLVVNATDPWRNGETGRGAPAASVTGLTGAVQRGTEHVGIVQRAARWAAG